MVDIGHDDPDPLRFAPTIIIVLVIVVALALFGLGAGLKAIFGGWAEPLELPPVVTVPDIEVIQQRGAASGKVGTWSTWTVDGVDCILLRGVGISCDWERE